MNVKETVQKNIRQDVFEKDILAQISDTQITSTVDNWRGEAILLREAAHEIDLDANKLEGEYNRRHENKRT